MKYKVDDEIEFNVYENNNKNLKHLITGIIKGCDSNSNSYIVEFNDKDITLRNCSNYIKEDQIISKKLTCIHGLVIVIKRII
jgi:hypothetical protein